MAQIKGNLLYIDHYEVFDILPRGNNHHYEWFEAIPDSALLDVRLPRSVLRVFANGEEVGRTDREPGYSNIKKCLSDGWKIVALKREARIDVDSLRATRIDFDGRTDTNETQEHQRGFVSFVGIGPDATDDELRLFDAYVNARRCGVDCPALVTKAFTAFAKDYGMQDVPEVCIPEKERDVGKPKQAPTQKQIVEETTKSGCMVLFAVPFLAIALWMGVIK